MMIVTLYAKSVKLFILYENLYEEIRISNMVERYGLEIIDIGVKYYKGQELSYHIITGRKSDISRLIYGCHIPMVLKTGIEKPIFKTIYFNIRV